MDNFCSSCGSKLKSRDRFCPNCGLKLKVSNETIGQWEVKERDAEGFTRRRGFLTLTRNELIYLSKIGLFSKKQKEYCRIPVSKIKRVYRTPLANLVSITYSKAHSGAGTFRRFFGKRYLSFKMKNSKSFIEKLKSLNPNIKA